MQFSLSEKPESYGNHFIIGLASTKLEELDKRILGTLKPAGILLLGRNFARGTTYREWLGELKTLLKEVKNYAERDQILVSLDHEGGRVHRAPAPITLFPEAMRCASSAEAVAKAMAVELKSMGVNLSWAPVADIHSNPTNPIIGNRAFGKDAESVSVIAAKFTRALDAEGILTCAKHYPGHGDTETDSHLELPTLNLTEQELKERELRPFKAQVAANVPFMMTAHILYPKIDPLYPATLSEKILKGFLREELNYNGIIVSDDLDMKAVSAAFKSDETIGLAVRAGCDMFIVARQPDPSSDRPLVLAKSMYACLKAKKLSEELLHKSFQRIEELFKTRVKMYEPEILAEEVLAKNAKLAAEIRG